MKNICDWNNCNEIGDYKAPVEKDNSKKFRMLCLEHVKEFNKNWNYFENMNDHEIEISSSHRMQNDFEDSIHRLHQRFIKVLGENDIEIPFPSQTLFVESLRS